MNAQHNSNRRQNLSRRRIATLLLMALLSVVLRAGPGDLDRTFSGAAPGDLDPTFSGDGKLTDQIISGLSCGGLAVAVQSDGKIVAVGWSYNGSGDEFALIRYNTDGSLDTSFDGDGKVTTPIGTASIGSDPDDEAYAIAIQSDGKIVVAGSSESLGNNDFAVVRYNPDGSLDTSFGGDGKVTTPIGSGDDSAYAVAIQPDGKIVVSGLSSNDASSAYFAVVRYNPNGSLDTSFDGDGKVTTPMGGGYGGGASAVAIQPDGKIVAVGYDTSPTSFAVVRYNADGSLDTSFGGDGKVTTQVGTGYGGASAVAIQPDGKIVAAGVSIDDQDTPFFAVVRYNTDGSPDTSFDGDGMVTTEGGGASDVTVQLNGKIVSAGTSVNFDFALVRYNTDGSLDTTFGGGDGISTIDFNNSASVAHGMALDGQGRAVVVGESAYSFALARILLDDGPLTPDQAPFDFDGDGKTDIGVTRDASTKEWWLDRSTAGMFATSFGVTSDLMTPADFTGDGKTDISVFRPSSGEWYVMRSEDFTYFAFPFGINGDVPAPADYDADGKADAAVFRPSNATWYQLLSASGNTPAFQFGIATDKPVVADYDGDGKADIAVFRPSDGSWWINRSAADVFSTAFGVSTDKPVPADYTGDRKADLAVWRPASGEWFVLRSENLSYYAFPFGQSGDIPAPGDYDGDGKADAAVFRNGTWYLNRSTAGILIRQFGLAGDRPVPNAYVP